MKRLNRPSTPPPFLDSFVAIRDSMQNRPDGPRRRLTRRHRAISTRYEDLEEAVSEMELEGLIPSAYLNPLSDDFEAAYTGQTKALRDLKAAIKNVQAPGVLAVCPLCKISLPRTFDHYLPLGTFPEFAVHPLNLMPSCQSCNGKKLEAWLNADGDRVCLYLYGDTPSPLAFIECRLTAATANDERVGVTFELNRPPGMRQARWDPLVRHFNRLGLIERYNELGNDELTEVLSNARDFLDNGGPRNRVRRFIRSGAARLSDMHGLSYWRAELRRRVADATELFSWLER
jgi:hypothetical protein